MGVFLANPGHVCGRGEGHLVKIEWLVADVTAVGSLDRAKRAILGGILAGRVFGQFRSYLLSGSHYVGWEPPF